MRHPTDLCLLCKIREATKTNSHILSRFISTAFLEGGRTRKGFSLDSDNVLKQDGNLIALGKTKTIQDSPKENYILCPVCEEYLSVIEGLSRDTFILWRDKVASKEFALTTILPNELELLDCKSSNSRIIRLFAYSLFWRASISSLNLFADYTLPCHLEEELRIAIHSYEGDRNGFLAKVAATPKFANYPYRVMTADVFTQGDANFLMAIPPVPAGNSTLIVDRFAFTLYESSTSNNNSPYGQFNNVGLADCRIMVIPEANWKIIFNQAPAKILLDQAKIKLDAKSNG